jgi:AmmeMemoRadiSam system protein B
MSSRVMSVAGAFYPNSCKAIKQYISKFNRIGAEVEKKFEPKALIVPHAGYVYSGYTANSAYRLVNPKNFKRVVVIGPSHRYYFKGASVALYDNYDTPCGSLPIDVKYSRKLIENNKILVFIDNMHHEHSTEVQFPFIQHYLPEVKVVEIVYGDIDYKDLALIVKKILNETRTLLIISTDLSHFYPLNVAKDIDSFCIKGIKELNLDYLNKCEACGIIGVKALISVASETQIVDYRTSFDASGDSQRVVGYLSALAR